MYLTYDGTYYLIAKVFEYRDFERVIQEGFTLEIIRIMNVLRLVLLRRTLLTDAYFAKVH